MKSKYSGSLDELKAVVDACKMTGDWSENAKNRFHSFHAWTGEVLNWWPSTGTIQFQGKRAEEFRALFYNSLGADGPESDLKASDDARFCTKCGATI